MAHEILTEYLKLTQFMTLVETTAPAIPLAGQIKLYADLANTFARLRLMDETGLIQTLLRDGSFVVYNNSGSTIAKGAPVYITGSFSGVTSFVPTIALAKADVISTSPAFGLAAESIANSGYGRVAFQGLVSGIDTSAFSAGAQLYLSAATAGVLTATAPVAPSISQSIGYVTNSGVSGSIALSIRAALNTASGSYLATFKLGSGSGASAVTLQFLNANTGTLSWNPGASFTLRIPAAQGASNTFLQNDGAGNLSWTTVSVPSSDADGGSASSNYGGAIVLDGGTA